MGDGDLSACDFYAVVAMIFLIWKSDSIMSVITVFYEERYASILEAK